MSKFDVPKIKYNEAPTYDEVVAKVADISYESPIKIISQGVRVEIENEVMKSIHSYGIDVDKEELIKALEYDRKQYEKGWADGYRVGKSKCEVEALIDKIATYFENPDVWGDLMTSTWLANGKSNQFRAMLRESLRE